MISVEKLKEELPYGSLSEIAKNAGVSKTAVTKFFNGKTKSSLKIRKAALKIAIKAKRELQGLETQFETLN